jgi:hypothetical protein
MGNNVLMIDANALDIDDYLEEFPECEWERGYNAAVRDIKNLIEAQDTIDAVPVVRCKDCKHFIRNEMDDTYCDCGGVLAFPEEHDFCSWGERKDDGTV